MSVIWFDNLIIWNSNWFKYFGLLIYMKVIKKSNCGYKNTFNLSNSKSYRSVFWFVSMDFDKHGRSNEWLYKNSFIILNEILYNHHITPKYCKICYNLSETSFC